MRMVKGIILFLLMILWMTGGWIWYKYYREPAAGSARNGQALFHVRTAPGVNVKWTFETEQHWLVDEIGRDIAEMILYAKDAKIPVADVLEFKTKILPDSSNNFTFSAKSSSILVTHSLSLKHHLWASENYTPWANTLLDSWKVGKPTQNSPPNAELLKQLASPSPQTLVSESQRISKELSQHPLDAELHEEAALVLGYFGLQEAAGQFADTRRTLCRMSAHLALARTLHDKTSVCGQVAEVAQLSLINRETESLEKIGQFPPELSTWANALKIRCTGDWRILPNPEKTSLLEQMEHGRALVRSIDVAQLLPFLEKTQMPQMPLWNRIAMERRFSVQEGHIFAKQSLAAELQSLAEDWKAWSGKELQEGNLVQIINDPATRCVIKSGDSDQQLEVLSWGNIASFHQRHICHSIQRTIYFLRSMWGVPDMAAQFEQAVNEKLSGLRLYPIVFKCCAQDKSQYSKAMTSSLELCNKQPELVTAANWCCLREQTNFGNQNAKMPDPLNWFTPVLPFGTAYDFNPRYYKLYELYKADLAFWNELITDAPYYLDIIRACRYKKFGDKPTTQQVQDSFVKIIDYDLIAMKETADMYKNNPKAYEKYMRKACELDPDLYLGLGAYFLEQNQTDAAVFAYQAAFEMAPDRVRIANSCDWIVNYYFDHNRKDDALKIATEAAEVYSAGGLETMAKLMERMGKLEEAEKHYAAIKERYNDSGALASFYQRNQDKNPSFAAKLKKITAEFFPNGMEKVQLSDFTDAPADGVSVNTTNANTNRANLKRGDVFVALDGWRVRNLEQYMWVRGMKKDPLITLIVWNGSKYVEISISLPDRRFGNDISTYQGR